MKEPDNGTFNKKWVYHSGDGGKTTTLQSIHRRARWKRRIRTYIQRRKSSEITMEKIIHALKIAKNGRSPDPDKLPNDILKMIPEKHMEVLINPFNKIHQSSDIPQQWLTSNFIYLLKKSNNREYNDHLPLVWCPIH